MPLRRALTLGPCLTIELNEKGSSSGLPFQLATEAALPCKTGESNPSILFPGRKRQVLFVCKALSHLLKPPPGLGLVVLAMLWECGHSFTTLTSIIDQSTEPSPFFRVCLEKLRSHRIFLPKCSSALSSESSSLGRSTRILAALSTYEPFLVRQTSGFRALR